MPSYTTNHGLSKWAAGELDWQHNDDMDILEDAVEIRDVESNLNNYEAKADAKFVATDTHAVYLGDGTNWNAITFKPTQDHINNTSNPHSVTPAQINALPTSGGTLSGDLTLDSAAALNLNLGSDIHPTVDSSQSAGDDPAFDIAVTDSQGARPEIHWRRRVTNADSTDEALSVYDATNTTELFTVRESGAVDVAGALGVTGQTTVSSDIVLNSTAEIEFGERSDIRTVTDSSGAADPQEFNIRHSDNSGADTIHWRRNAATPEAFGVQNYTTGTTLLSVADDGTTQSAGSVSSSGGFIAEQRGAPTTSELADGERMQYTSDGSDGHSAGDLVSARNNAGTIVSQVIAAAADDA